MNRSYFVNKITQRKKSNTSNVLFNNSFEIEIHNEIINKYNLISKKQISDEIFEKIINDQNFLEAKKIAYNYVSYKPRTEYQVIQKLKEKKFEDEIINKTINFLKEFNLIDDEKYAKQFSKDFVQRKKIGKTKLILELQKRGINGELALKTANEIFQNIDFFMLASELCEKKLKIIKNKTPEKRKNLLIQHLQRQGFDWDITKKILEHYQNNFK